jgi:hypothetical protein
MTATWKTMLVIIFTGLLVSFGFMKLMSECARCLAMSALAIMLLAFFGGGLGCIYAAMTGNKNAAGENT